MSRPLSDMLEIIAGVKVDNAGDFSYSIKFEISSHIASYDNIPFHTEEINTDTFYPKKTWPTKHEAIDAMIDSLQRIKLEDQKECNHYWIAEQAELLLAGYEVPLNPASNKKRCNLCGVYDE